MFRNFHVGRLFWRIFLFIGLIGGSIGQAAPVKAAPGQVQTELKYSVTLFNTHIKYCAGFDYDLTVRVSMFERAVDENGQFIAIINTRGARAEIEASSADPSIASMKTSAASTAPDVSNGGDGEAVISFHANKKGQTSIKFITTLHDEGQQLPEKVEAINVENCPYTVFFNVVGIELAGDINIWTAGRMQADVADDNGRMSGMGTLKFTSGANVPGCKIDYSDYEIPVNISGPGIENDVLKLNFSLGSGTIDVHGTCGGDSGGGTPGIDLSGLTMPVFTFPPEGGSNSYTTDYLNTHATFIITVVPKE